VLSVKGIEQRFHSNRTEFGKLKRRIKEAKSGRSILAELTSKQKWKLRAFTFYEPFLKRRRQDKDAEMGNVSIRRTRDLRFENCSSSYHRGFHAHFNIVISLCLPQVLLLIPFLFPYAFLNE
jgi:uncharacterized sporulation protein YeaH/YhbH (DUF444 family)